jgi:hypothetical protein
VLARRRPAAAVLWQESFAEETHELADAHVFELANLEKAHGIQLRTVADQLHEQFVKPLALDRLCAQVEPAMAEARAGTAGPAFARFEQELHDFTESPTGVGLDVPKWILRLQGEVQRVQAARTETAELADRLFQIPRGAVSFEELRQQLEDGEE